MRRIIHHFRSTRRISRFGLAAAFIVWFGLGVLYQSRGALASLPQGDDGKITHTANGNTEIWQIVEPNVKQRVTQYPQIRFQPGDSVTIVAGGCVQTGGFGPTWKLYVNPQGPNADHLYHGLILIPGVAGALPGSAKLTRISVAKGIWQIPAGFDPRQLYLRLGYEDDDYSDNGYWGHDDGTGDQCKGVGNAFVNLIIIHGATASPTPSPAPFDLSLNNIKSNGAALPPFDDNGLLFMPMWGWQLNNGGELPDANIQCNNKPYLPPCTSQPTIYDNADIVCPLFGYDGHGNWAVATYQGPIAWESHSQPGTDDDYNLRLVPLGKAGLTVANQESLLLEFDSDETIDHFRTPWWDSLHSAVDRVDEAQAQLNSATSSNDPSVRSQIPALTDALSRNQETLTGMLNGKDAIATGLVGLDCAHGCSSELHPIFALAIRVKDDPSDEVWAIFVRRWGNEGFCSENEYYLDDLPGDTLSFRLPWRGQASAVTVAPGTIFKSRLGQASGPDLLWAPNQGVRVSFTLPVPQSGDGERVNGELHLQWTGAAKRLRGTGYVAYPETNREDEPEERFAQLVAKMTPAQRKAFNARIPQKTISYDGAVIRSAGPPRQTASVPVTFIRAQRPHVRAVIDSLKKAKDQQKLDALRSVYGNNIPGSTNRGRRVTPFRM